MRLAYLYLRSRRTEYTALALMAVAALGWLAADWLLRAPFGGRSAFVPVLFYIPMVAAMVIGVSTYCPFGEEERAASRSLPGLRLVHLSILLIWSLAALELLAIGRGPTDAELMLARNLAGFTGLGLLTARFTGSRLSWVGPFAYSVLALLTGVVGANQFAWWVWPLRPVDDVLAAAIALVLLASGSATFCLYGNLENSVEAH